MENNLRQFKIDIQTGLILAKDERVSEWTISIEDPFLRFHDAMHSLLVNFLNATDLSPVGAVMPMRYAQIPGSKKLNIAVEAAKTLDVKTPHLSRVASQALSSSRDWANAIAEGYGILMDNAFQRDNFARHIVRSEIDRNEWMEIVSRRNYRPLSSFIDYLLNLNLDGISGFWLHGSLATMDYLPGYSDCDATVIINKGSSTDPDALLCMRKELSRVSCALHNIDLLQHHGLFVVSELDLRSYHQSFFPLGIIERSVEILHGATKIEYYECGLGFSSEKAVFLKMVQLMRAVSCGVVHLRTAYAIKAHIQTLIILWVIYLQLRDEKFWHKQDALDKKPEEIPAEIWSIIESITKLRQEWKLNIKFPLVNLLGRWNSRLPPLMLRAISFMYAKSISRRLLPDWQDACTDLSEFLLADLRTRGKL